MGAPELEALSLQEPLFHHVKYYLSGEVPDKITELLAAGGAERAKYFSDFVTHLLCGSNTSDTDLTEATELYEIPAVTIHWVLACVRLKKLVGTKPYNPSKNQIFSNVVACVSKVGVEDAKKLFALITYYGGQVKIYFDSKCTHLICGSAAGKKYNLALTLASFNVKIVTPDWVLESIRARIQAVAEVYHPRLLIIPQPAPTKSGISAITGFDFEEGIAKNEVPTQNLSENKDDSTQALLDKLKQRMPWNHPPSAVSSSSPSIGVSSSGQMTTPQNPNVISKTIPQGIMAQNMQKPQPPMVQQFNQNIPASQPATSLQSQMNLLQSQQQVSQLNQQPQPHGLSAIQIQQQRLLQQHQLRMQMLQQQNQNKNPNQQQQQAFLQQQQIPNQAPQVNQSMQNQMQHIQTSQHHIVQQNQNINQTPNTTLSSQAQQQIQHISQMLSQSANNMQRAQVNQQKQGLLLSQHSAANQAVQNIAQQLAQSTQNLQQSLQNAQNQNLSQNQMLNQQQLINNSVQSQSQNNLMQQQTVQSLGHNNQQQNINTPGQQGLIAQASQGQSSQGNMQLAGAGGQQSIMSQQMQNVQQPVQGQQGANLPIQGNWRQQNIQMIQNAQGQHQIIRGPLVQQRNQQNQMIIQQQLIQNQQQAIMSNQQQQSPQHTIQQGSPQIIQGQGQGHHQILVQKQQLLNGGQQQIVQTSQQVLINQHSGQQQILVHGNQHVTLQGGQQIVSQGQIGHQGAQQIIGQSGPQIITQGGQQVISQGGQHLIAQGSQHQVVIAQSSQQIVSQSGQQILSQNVGQAQQVLSQVQPGQQGSQVHQITQQGNIQQIITHGGGQQLVAPAGQQIVQGQNISWQQQQYLQQRQQQIGQPGTVGPRVSWAAGGGGRQLIHLDAQTHAQLQQMDPQQRALFVAQLQKRRQLSMQRAAALAQQQAQQQPAVGGVPTVQSPAGTAQSVTFIRGKIPPGLTQQQQVQWLQQQGARAAALPATPPAPPPQSPVPVSPVGGVGGGGAPVETQLQQLQMQRQQQYQRLQQLQAQRDHVVAHHHAKAQGEELWGDPRRDPTASGRLLHPGGCVGQDLVGVAGAVGVQARAAAGGMPEQTADGGLLAPTTPEHQQGGSGALLVNPKTKTALANMLNTRLQGAAPPPSPAPEHEPSAAGTLRLMTAAHAAAAGAGGAGGARQPPARLLLHTPLHHQHQQQGVGAKVYGASAGAGAGAVRAPPPRAQFYGHNPNLKLPPDLYLLGCVFHIVEYQQSWGAERVARWAEAVGRRGGEVEPSYCARVTHVLCETQKHGVVMQALRDAKRCVTAYWLSDAMVRRAVAPPNQALHLPTMYAARDRPARHHRAAMSGWRGEERDKITFMMEHIGAKLTPYMSKDNTVLVCKRPEGNKFRRARDWGLPIVSAAWLTDLLLGNMSALSQIENAKYQQFNVGNPFRMDYSLVSHLMNAWKMPINITQESHERVKRGALPTNPRRAKRARLEACAGAEPPAPARAPLASLDPPPAHLAPRVLFSATKQLGKLSIIVKQLGGRVVTQPSEATHLIMDGLVRTGKLVACLVTVKHLLAPDWLYESQRVGKFADEAQFGLRDDAFNEMFRCDVSEVLLCGEQRRKLFEGVTFFLTPCVQPSRAALTEMIELCGGKVDKNRKSFVGIQEMHKEKPYSYLVLTVPNDLHLVYYLLQAEKTLNVVCNTELVLSAILRQKVEVEEFLVKID